MSKGGARQSKTDQKRLEALERQRKALELRKFGVGFQAIADQLGYADASGAYRAVMAGLKKTLQEPADEVRKMELERLDVAMLAIQAQVRAGHLAAIDKWLKIMERRARLLGLDAPAKAVVTGESGGPLEIHVTYEEPSSQAAEATS